jgi:hypothetical protein
MKIVPVSRIALADLFERRHVMWALGLLVALPVLMLTIVDGYVRGVEKRFGTIQSRLVVQQESTVAEFTGSRIPASVGTLLRAHGVVAPVPEVHAITGTTSSDAMLITGVDPTRYLDLDPYRMISGKGLGAAPDDGAQAGRTAIIGTSLADRLGAGPGDIIRVRGRDVAVLGVFEVGTYLDDAVVMPLIDAQRLLGWGDDVSLYVVPVDAGLVAGQILPGGLLVANRGDVAAVGEFDPLFTLLSTSVRLLAAGAVLVLAVALWRLAWLRRTDLGLLRMLGLGRSAVAVYLATQAIVLVASGATVGLGAAIVLAPRLARTVLAVTAQPEIDGVVILHAVGAGLLVMAIALVVPLLAMQKMGVRALLRRED